MPTSTRQYVPSHFALELDGIKIGFLQNVEGGSISAEVISLIDGTSVFANKHLGPLHYEDFTVQVGMSMGQPLFDWINAAWQGKAQHKDGSIIAYDANYKPLSQRQFYHALISEITVPKLDASSKDAAYFTVTITPEGIQQKAASGTSKPPATKEKLWQAANFRLNVDGLDTKTVSQVDAFTVKQKPIEYHKGDGSGTQLLPGKLEFPNLAIYLPLAQAQPWQKWFESFVIQGKNSDKDEKNGSLVFLAPNLKTELARINCFKMGIFKLAPDNSEAKGQNIKRVKAELYVERMEIVFSGSKT